MQHQGGQRLLGPARLPVSALALSGHYHLPPEGFAIAVNRGVNLFFWESNYDTLTSFSRSLATRERQQLHFIAGTFEATPQAVRKDAERALRVLHLERLDLFLLFWTRSWQRLDDELRELVAGREPIRRLKDLARRKGTRSLVDAALDLVRNGETTLEEVRRVTVAA